MHNAIRIETRPVAAIHASPHQARTHNKKQQLKTETSLRRFGLVQPLLVTGAGEIVDGHLRFEVAPRLGYDEVPVIVVDHLSDPQIRALRLALNRIPLDAGWDEEKLRGEFAALLSLGMDLDLTGFDAPEIDMRLSVDEPQGETSEELPQSVVEPAGTAISQIGDRWTLCPHRIACTDARDKTVFPELLRAKTATAVFTDSPYNLQINGVVSGLGKTRHAEFAMASGEMSADEFLDFNTAFLSVAASSLDDGGLLFCCMDWRHVTPFIGAAEALGLELKNICVWVKTNAGMGTFYRSQHELVCIFKKGVGPHQNHFELGQHGRSRSNVWRYAGVNVFGKDRELLGVHPTVKPVAMIADALRDVTRRGDIVLDPFLGSGSTLIAAEKTGRVCVGTEIAPVYVDATIRRWESATGLDAVHEGSGQTFSERRAAGSTTKGISSDINEEAVQ